MKKILIIFSFLFCLFAKAENKQNKNTKIKIETNIQKINLNIVKQGIEYCFEKRLFNSFSVLLTGSLHYHEFDYISHYYFFNDEDYSETIFSSRILIEPRYYYNFSERVINEDDIKNNSANFLSLKKFIYLFS